MDIVKILTVIKDVGNEYVWSFPSNLFPDILPIPLLVLVLLGTGIFVTVRFRLIQIRKFRHAVQVTRGVYDNPDDAGDINHFQALSAALSATIGIGNIAGVATAIHYGGPGALFWMWITAIFGMALKYAEATLAIHYRIVHQDGSVSGGPMYYIVNGLGKKWMWLAMAFAFFAAISSFGQGNMIQSFTVTHQLYSDFGIPRWITSLAISILVGLVIIGGIKRIGKVAAKLTPIMALTYVAGALIIILLNLPKVPETFALIFREAFAPRAEISGLAGGGFLLFLNTMLWGVKRGLFSNEAGQGSAPIAHAAAKTEEPVREGAVAMLGPFIDTIVICTMTGLIITLTGAFQARSLNGDTLGIRIDPGAGSAALEEVQGNALKKEYVDRDKTRVTDDPSEITEYFRDRKSHPERKILLVTLNKNREQNTDEIIEELKKDLPVTTAGSLDIREKLLNGSPMTTYAFREGLVFIGGWGGYIVTLAVILFAISTAISWSYYGDRSAEFLFGRRAVLPYRIIYVIVLFLGGIFSLEIVWGLGDIAIGLMAFPNLIAIIFLSGKVREMTNDYFSRKHVPYKRLKDSQENRES